MASLLHLVVAVGTLEVISLMVILTGLVFGVSHSHRLGLPASDHADRNAPSALVPHAAPGRWPAIPAESDSAPSG